MKFNKKVVAGVAAIALALSAATGFTFAYFTDTEGDLTNTVTFGHVDISFTETSEASEGVLAGEETYTGEEPDEVFTGLSFTDVMPGDVYSKEPVVTVETDSQDAYVRIQMLITVTDVNGDNDMNTALDVEPDDVLSWLNIDEDNEWNLEIGTVETAPVDPQNPDTVVKTLEVTAYYDAGDADSADAILSATEYVTLFTTVTFPGMELNNYNIDDEYSIVMTAEAIQADNFTPDDDDATPPRIDGWDSVEILSYE